MNTHDYIVLMVVLVLLVTNFAGAAFSFAHLHTRHKPKAKVPSKDRLEDIKARVLLKKAALEINTAEQAVLALKAGEWLHFFMSAESNVGAEQLQMFEELYENLTRSFETYSLARERRVQLDWAAAIESYRKAVIEDDWGTQALRESVAVYREALEELPRERVPFQWAMAMNNLGTALLRLGERESGIENLQNAAAAYREVLSEWTRERAPSLWAMVMNNLGITLLRLGERYIRLKANHEALHE